MAAVPADRRYVRGRRCPVCDGADNDPRGADRRCFGFLSEDGLFAHCSREEHAGSLKQSEGSQTYGHRRAGPCGCGAQHSEPALAAVTEPQQQRRIVREYDYRDESGVLVYQVVRFEPKAFRQRRPDPDRPSSWLWNLEGVRRVLYRLDRVMEADPEATIWVVEGEKDVEALETLGLVATCNPQGAGKWAAVQDCAAQALAGRSVVVIADADDKGRSHAADIVARLAGVVLSARSIELPGAKDAADWVRDGGSAERLLATAASPVTAAHAAPDPAKDFDRSEDGKIYHSQKNIRLALAKLGVTIRYDVFGDRELVDGLDGFGPEVDDATMNRLRMSIDSRFGFRLSKDFFYDFVADYAHDRRHHPVRDYLDSLRWDGVPRIDSWLTRYAGAADTAYTRAVGAIVLVAAVRRVRQPGCKYDEMLILESDQGKHKSTALAVLAGNPEWFSDDLPLGADTQRLMESTSGRWIIEAGELKGMSRGDVHELKGYLSRTSDSARMAYGRKRKPAPRQFIIIGTTNETTDYLRDNTGSRRFWPVRIFEFDVAKLRADRDQLWAEASARESAGASIRLDPSLYSVAAVEQEERRADDAMEDLIARVFGETTGKVPAIEAWQVLGVEGRALTGDELARFTAAMRRLGWAKSRRRFEDGERETCYVKGDASQVLTVSGKGPYATVKPDLSISGMRGRAVIGRDLRTEDRPL